MSIYKMNFFSSVSFLERQWHQRLVQICVFAALLFFLLGSYDLIDQVQKMLRKVGLKFGKDSTRVVNAVLFGLLLFLLTRFVMDPVVKRMANGTVVEGQRDQTRVDLLNKLGAKLTELQVKAADGDQDAGRRVKALQFMLKKMHDDHVTEGGEDINMSHNLMQSRLIEKLVELQQKAADGDQDAQKRLIVMQAELKRMTEAAQEKEETDKIIQRQELAEEKEYLDQQLLQQQEAALEADIKDKLKDKIKEKFDINRYFKLMAAADTPDKKCQVNCKMAPLNPDSLCMLYKNSLAKGECKNPCPACP